VHHQRRSQSYDGMRTVFLLRTDTDRPAPQEQMDQALIMLGENGSGKSGESHPKQQCISTHRPPAKVVHPLASHSRLASPCAGKGPSPKVAEAVNP
jgi:hypothetical protein